MNSLEEELRLVLLGPPGSGKGTQAHYICVRHGIAHVSTGDILRNNTREGTELGKTAAQIMKQGNLVPDELIFDLLTAHYKQAGGEHLGFVLDGFPRSEHQAKELSGFLKRRNQRIDQTIMLELDDDVIVGRLIHRRTCPSCGRSYHLQASPPKQEGLCDDDGSELIWRADDTEDVIRNRLNTYHQQTKPVAGFYEKQGILARIDASDSIEAIQKRIESVLDEIQGAKPRSISD